MPENDEQKRRKLERDRAYAASHREEARARANAWYAANKERAARYKKENYGPAAAREYGKKYRAEKAEALRAYDRMRAQRDDRKEAHRLWRKKNSAKVVA